jgi:O-acetyl-ADP-ribose deacetylase (regulator of RNase III)
VVDPLAYAETLIAATMRERIARILYLFHTKGARHLVLGSFGTGVFQNSVDLIAEIFKDLLCEPREQEDKVQETDEKPKEDKQDENGVGQVEKDRPLLGTSSLVGKGTFSNTFDTVMFAILGGSTVRTFQKAFEGEVGVEIDEDAQGHDVEGMRDAADFRVQDGRDRAA